MALVVAAFLCLSLAIIVFLFVKWRFTYWKRRGVSQLEPEFFYGDARRALTGQVSNSEELKRLYDIFKERGVRYGGIYWSFSPELVIIDTNLMKNIIQKDFSYFQGRGLYTHKNDTLSQNMFRLVGDPWKKLRVKLTPTFTSSKMKMMFGTVQEKEKRLNDVMEEYAEDGGIFEVNDVTRRFTSDIIGSCAFGIESDSLQCPKSELREYGDKVNDPKLLSIWLESTLPGTILSYTGYKCYKHVSQFYHKVVTDTINYRIQNKVIRNDFMHLLLQLRQKGFLDDESKTVQETGRITDDDIVAQCFLFFVAGYDTSASTLSYALYELAQHQDIQNKMREEICEVLKKYDNQLTYDALKDLVYTEKVICETLRKYPVVPTITRRCNQAYKVPGTDLTIEKGTGVKISVFAVQRDPEYFPDPNKFDPERFNEEEKAKRPEYTYFPFGDGPRVCIGKRFAMMQTKAGLVGLLKNHKYSFSTTTPTNLKFKKAILLLHTSHKVPLTVQKISQ
ncbi:hypothetical protein GWI33_015546 [Rhynchophorus ferrugineus]|uniref:Cytochrome P450 n=1 Tax=Rhynchophorus ferrugineus TaxID=354439 RepID=A0A834I2B5_RHYFE|nr:hypothetical protein GWI33_015546 [Rhynchophorus ferrugineus]